MRWILALLTGLVVAAALTGWGQAQRPAHGPQDDDAARAVRALTGDPAGDAPGPGPVKADACSSPFGSTWYGFGPACARHDAGYDQLRLAALRGRPLGPWARQAIDHRFAQDLARGCGTTGCLLTSALYTGSVRFNSWRQGDGAPVVEPWWGTALALLGGLGAGLLVALRTRPRPGLPLVAAGAGLALALQPTMLPHPVWVTALVGGLVAAQGWAAGVGLRRLLAPVRRRLTGRLAAGDAPVVVAAGWGLLAAGFALAVAAAYDGQVAVATSVGAVPPSPGSHLLGAVGGAALAAALVVAVRGARRLPGLLARWASPSLSLLASLLAPLSVRGSVPAGRRLRRPASGPAVLAVPVVLLTAWAVVPSARAVPPPGPTDVPSAAVALSVDPSTWPGPTAASTRFVSAAADARHAALRVYVPRDAAGTAEDRARLAVQGLDRVGGFDRSIVLVTVPTGSGWVNPDAPAGLERRADGDLATVAVQYAASPSWIAFLRGGDGADASVRALFAALDARLARIPASRRPLLLVYGESLGAWAGLRAATSRGLPAGADGALWAGIPAGSPRSGAPRSATPEAGTPEAGTACGAAVELTHADDPVGAWSPALAVRPSAAWPRHWLPVVSFWQATGDAIAARDVPAGHGHRYGNELGRAWDRVLAGLAPGTGCRA